MSKPTHQDVTDQEIIDCLIHGEENPAVEALVNELVKESAG